MSDSESLQSEYQRLKHKIQSRVKDLENNFIDQNRTMASAFVNCPNHNHRHGLCPVHSQYPSQNFLHSDRESNFIELSSRVSEQYQAANNSIAEALKQNMKIQRQMSNNLRLLNQKITEMNVRPEQNSRFIDQLHQTIYNRIPIDKNRVRVRGQRHASSPKAYSLKNYARRETSNSSKLNNKFLMKQGKKISNHSGNKQSKREKTDQSLKSQCDEQYFVFKGKKTSRCPLHEAKKMKEKLSKRQKSHEVFKDSLYRNKKHQRDHLLNSYHQQQKSRKEILTKIARNFINNHTSIN